MPKPVRLISDIPKERNADFGFQAYVNTIAGLIANRENGTPLVIGIYGKWGSGKTTLMRSIQAELSDRRRYPGHAPDLYRPCKPVWFQAWKYKNEDEILAALIQEIFITMERDDTFTHGQAKLEAFIKHLDKPKLAKDLIKAATGINLGGFFKQLGFREKLGFYDEFRGFFNDLILTYLSPDTRQKERFEEWDSRKGALVVFIDDLDRCPARRIVDVLETVKLFMDMEGCVIVIGADNEIIVKALEQTYR